MINSREIVILLPAYNEELNVEKMVATWMYQEKILSERFQLKLKLAVINDGSKDRTEDICKELRMKYSNFTYINHPHNKGLGEAVKTAITYVLMECPDCVYTCLMDCDNTQDPSYISSMLEKIGAEEELQTSDVVIASRYQKEAMVQGLSKFRLLTSEGAKYVYSFILPIKNVKDYTCGYRLYTRNILDKGYHRFGSSLIEESGFTCMAELLYKLYIVGARFEEVPFILRYDFKQGKSKMRVIKTAINSIKLAFRLRRLKRR